MIVVSDTSPLNYLVLVDAVHILAELYGEVVIPSAVKEELNHPRTPDAVRRWAQVPPSWLRVEKPTRTYAALKLDPGESEAIHLAKELRADHLLIDERDGTRVARAEGLRPLSTLAVLAQAAESGLVDLPKALQRLQTETTFRVTPKLVDHLLAKYAHKRGGPPR